MLLEMLAVYAGGFVAVTITHIFFTSNYHEKCRKECAEAWRKRHDIKCPWGNNDSEVG